MTSTAAEVPQAITHDESRTLFGQTMGLVALTASFFALGAYLGRDMVNVADADPAVVSLAWTRESARPEAEAFIAAARRVASPHTAEAEGAASAPD